MAIGNEAVTLSQFKVWAAKNSGGGALETVVLWEGENYDVTVESERQYRFCVVTFNGEDWWVPWGEDKSIETQNLRIGNLHLSFDGLSVTAYNDGGMGANPITKIAASD